MFIDDRPFVVYVNLIYICIERIIFMREYCTNNIFELRMIFPNKSLTI